MFHDYANKIAVTIKMESAEIANNSASFGGVDARNKPVFTNSAV